MIFFLLIMVIVTSPNLFAKIEYAAYPSAGYTTETGFYVGALSYLRYSKLQHNSRASGLYLSSTFSEKKQFIGLIEPIVYYADWRWKMSVTFKKWPATYYGTGMSTNREISEDFTSRETDIRLDIMRKLLSRWFGELHYAWNDFEVIRMVDGGMLQSDAHPGLEKHNSIGLGASLIFDDRDSESFPAKGGLYTLKVMDYSSLVKSDYTFQEVKLDLRRYLAINLQHTIAMQILIARNFGDSPIEKFYKLNDNLRGVISDLYIDKSIVAVRFEDRFFPWQMLPEKRFGLVIFAEIGEVASDWNDFRLSDLQLNGGLGFRYSFFVENRLNLRIDFGFGETIANISIGTGEAF